MIEQNDLDKQIYSEFNKFKIDFDKQVELHSNLKIRIRKFRDFMYKEVPKYIGNDLMPVMFSNLVKKHIEMFKIDDTNAYMFVASPKGIRKKYQYSKHTDELSLPELHTM